MKDEKKIVQLLEKMVAGQQQRQASEVKSDVTQREEQLAQILQDITKIDGMMNGLRQFQVDVVDLALDAEMVLEHEGKTPKQVEAALKKLIKVCMRDTVKLAPGVIQS